MSASDGPWGYYVHRSVIRARKMQHEFTVRVPGGDTYHGQAGDYMIEYADGSKNVLSGEAFEALYVQVDDASEYDIR